MKILVAGGAGYVGSTLVPRLIERGYEVTVVDLLWFGNALPEEVKVIEKDILSLQQEELVGYDQVIFLAGLSNDPMANFSPSMNFVANAAGPAYLAYIAKRAGVSRYIYASSCSVYGYAVDKLYDEESPATCDYPYGISKLQGERAVLQLSDDDFSVIALRKGTISGYSPRMRLDLVVNTMFKTAMDEGVIHVHNPAIWRPVLAMKDAVAAYIRSVEAPKEISGVFNVASGNFTVGEVADLVHDGVAEALGRDIKLDIQHIGDVRNYKVTWERAESILSFKPRSSVTNIVSELAEEFENFQDFENPNYYNIRRFKNLDIERGIGELTPVVMSGEAM